MPHSLALSPPVNNPSTNQPSNGDTTTTTTTTLTKSSTTYSGAPTQQGFSGIAAAFDGATDATISHGHSLQNGDIIAEPLLNAVLRFLVVFEALGSAILSKLVRQDFRSKAESIRSALTREKVVTIRQLVAAEEKRPPRPFLDSNATEALLWTKRVLSFVDALVANLLQDPGSQLRDATTAAYRCTLGVKHNMVTRTVFENALALLPDTTTFLCNLYNCKSPYDDKIAASFTAAMTQFRIAVKPHIDAFHVVFPEE